MDKLLFVDDDPHFLKINKAYFEKRHYTVETVSNASRAIEALKEQPFDCIILDILMPGPSGFHLCQQIKNETVTPVIFLTSLTEQDCMYRGFELGGDDYVTKPYEFRELELRIAARIRQARGILQNEILQFPPLSIDINSRRALVNGKAVSLTAYEFDILLLLARSPGKVYSLEAIYREIWRMPDLQSAQTVRVHLARMRHKLENACPERKFIELVWGKGFRFTSSN